MKHLEFKAFFEKSINLFNWFQKREADMGFLNLNDKHKQQIGLLNGFDASSRSFDNSLTG